MNETAKSPKGVYSGCPGTVNAQVSPRGTLELLSQEEVSRLNGVRDSSVYELFRRCALAVLNCEDVTDDASEVFALYADFSIEIAHRARGIKLILKNAPACAFVDGQILNGVRDHLFAVLRDIVFMSSPPYAPTAAAVSQTNPDSLHVRDTQPDSSGTVSNLVFNILRNAALLRPRMPPRLVVCWGGHSIGREEYLYSKAVGYQLGLRGLDICTGCGPGAMKGPMKGATIGHAKQRNREGRYIGITEPGIIAAESPNPIVNNLVILPDIEKRLEAFVRLGHGIIVFPGGVGTLEEILFLLGTLMDTDNADITVPLIFTAGGASRSYFAEIDAFLVSTLGEQVRRFYRIIEDDPVAVAVAMRDGMVAVAANRRATRDAFYYNWLLKIPAEMKRPFAVSHQSMATLQLRHDLPAAELAINLRRAFSGIVAGNVKDSGVSMIREYGPFQLNGDPQILQEMDRLLRGFVAQGRMKLGGKAYNPCYRIAGTED
ncbi:MAG: nucleotide 5'-monophosphate nucleosidase PpnN [Gammaproteobacteria bacterium]|nr:nucleotide 5'-monophosphate nucleosidase PpnN [Gammaproteobacteria bacterium]